MSTPAQESGTKSRLISHFEERPIQDHGSGWSSLWDTGNSNLWDRGIPSPALVDIIENHQQDQDLFYPFTADGGRKRALVPGCGRGYDVVMLALHGFDAYGLEISQTAVAEAEKYASSELKEPTEHNFGSVGNLSERPGTVKFVEGDFFADGWESQCSDGEKFDLIYDYTFLCALHPSQRRDWATRMASLLEKGGLLVCLEFPMYKDPKLPGPPWGLNGVHWNLLSTGGDGLVTSDMEEAEREKLSEGQFTRKVYIKPERTYEMGKGTDMLSVYVRK
ncbi:Thiopurine S-methyltransferase TPMT [Aspergillus sclerotialis]|uniref:Thiopurine S-methyltransferase TPMT n=1 Tax=Aspergillus sclerotialis TaxID=2070753 RepID=A0A3A2ZJS7_9EURO|nr:Thiopurine S-methyltransferase TPMT [Aspergillus sclerotialis]